MISGGKKLSQRDRRNMKKCPSANVGDEIKLKPTVADWFIRSGTTVDVSVIEAQVPVIEEQAPVTEAQVPITETQVSVTEANELNDFDKIFQSIELSNRLKIIALYKSAADSRERFPEINYNIILDLCRKRNLLDDVSIDTILWHASIIIMTSMHDNGETTCKCGNAKHATTYDEMIASRGERVRVYNDEFKIGILPFVLFCFKCRHQSFVWRIISTSDQYMDKYSK